MVFPGSDLAVASAALVRWFQSQDLDMPHSCALSIHVAALCCASLASSQAEMEANLAAAIKGLQADARQIWHNFNEAPQAKKGARH